MQEMIYEQAIEYLDRVPKFSPRSIANGLEPYNLTAISELLHRLGDPQDKLKFVHIAGTNGKGSTAAFLSRILMESGYRVGVYTSPHLTDYTERMQILIPGKAPYYIPGDDFGFLTGLVKDRAEDMRRDMIQYPSEFELISAMAFLYFLEQEVDVVVLETGLGGRLDATNVIKTPDLAIITTISYDHTEILGESLEQIAYEKAGIIKENGDVLLYPQPPEVEEVFDDICRERGAWLHRAILPGKITEMSLRGQVFDLPGLKDLTISLPGVYQVGNASLAIGAAKILGIDLMENFNAPYTSMSIAELWRRWHISLTTWFRDYVYFPLGGSRKGRLRKDINIMIVFLVSGLWHGAGMHYVAWGGINGLYQVIGERLKPIRARIATALHVKTDVLTFKLYKVAATFLLTLFSDIFFRANNMVAAGAIITSIFTTHNPWILFDGSLYTLGLGPTEFRFMLLCIGVLIFSDICKRMGICIREIIGRQGYVFRVLFLVFAVTFLLTFGIWGPGYDAKNFVYFQF